MFRFSYSCNSAELLPLEDVCESLQFFGYSGVELSFQRNQFDPFSLTDERVNELKDFFSTSLIKPVCISTATTKFLSDVPHEPSLINVDFHNRSRRSSLIAQGISLAERIGVPLVSFQSGYLREEHSGLARELVMEMLAEEINGLLATVHSSVRLVIEPEPGMFIETIADAKALIKLVDDPRFGLHLDIGHVFCTEDNYIEAIKTHARDAWYIHMADINHGFNLKYRTAETTEIEHIATSPSPEGAVLYDVDGTGLFLFVHEESCIFIVDGEVAKSVARLHPGIAAMSVEKPYLEQMESVGLQQEILAYLDSVAGIDYERVLRAYGAIACLRLGDSEHGPVITDVVCNTVNGKVHYHDLFGSGMINYADVLSALVAAEYNGFCTVELYNHASLWREIAPKSVKYLLSQLIEHFGWMSSEFGHIDHRIVKAPYIRVADAQLGAEGGLSVLYDLRLSQPNTEALSPASLHTLEHCFLWLLPGLLPGFLNVAPMGCRTGLYLTGSRPQERESLYTIIIKALNDIGTIDQVPYQTEMECGMADDHDLVSAKEIAHRIAAAMTAAAISATK